MKSLDGGLLGGLRLLLGRAESLSSSATRSTQTGVLAADALDVAKASLRVAISALEQLEASMTSLSKAL